MKKAYEQQVKKILLAAFVILNISYLLVVKLIFGYIIKPDQGSSQTMWIAFYAVIAILGIFTYLRWIRTDKKARPAEQES